MNSSFSTISFGMKSLFFLLSLINHCLFIDGFHIQSAHNLYSSHLFGGNQHTMMEPVDSNAAGVVSTGLYKIVSSADYNFERVKTDLSTSLTKSDDPVVIQLGEITSGWGNGAHPTTRLCLEFISEYVQQGDKVLDYGTGSGVLSILAAKRGASRCVAVDIDEETLRAAEQNAVLNGVGDILDVVHTKYVYVGEDRFPICDITVANILPGALSRLVSTIWSFTKPGGRLCLSGIRPHELPAIERIYSLIADPAYNEVRQVSHPMYGDWVAWSTRIRVMSDEEVRSTRQTITEITVS